MMGWKYYVGWGMWLVGWSTLIFLSAYWGQQ